MPVSVAAALLMVALAAPAAARGLFPIETATSDGNFTIQLRGRAQVDMGWVGDSEDATSDGTPSGARFGTQHDIEVRSVQFGVQGHIYDRIFYKAGGIRAGGRTKFTDTFVETRLGAFELTLGHFREAVSMDEETGRPNVNMLERAAFTDAWDYRRRLGVGLDLVTRSFVLETAVQTDNISQHKAERDRLALSARAIFLPIAEKDRMVHLAAYAMERRRDRDLGPPIVHYSVRSVIHPIDQRFVDTGDIPAKGDHIYGLELAGLAGPLNATAEAAFLKVDPLTPGGPSPDFKGGYVEIGYFLTGESRPYEARQWGHVKPARPLDQGGAGAVEVLARIDSLDLEDRAEAIRGGRQTEYILGLNWYPIDHVRLMANAAIVDVTDSPAFRNAAGKDRLEILGLRGQINW